MSFKYSRAKTTLVSSILFFAGVGHSQAEAIQEAGRFDYRIEIPAGETDPATFIPVTAIRGVKPGPRCLSLLGFTATNSRPSLRQKSWLMILTLIYCRARYYSPDLAMSVRLNLGRPM